MRSFQGSNQRRGLEPLSPPAFAAAVLVALAGLVLAVLGTEARPWTSGAALGHVSTGWLRVLASLAVLVGVAVLALAAVALVRLRRRRRRKPELELVLAAPPWPAWQKLVVLLGALLLGIGPIVGGIVAARFIHGTPQARTTPFRAPIPPASGLVPAARHPSAGGGLNVTVLVGGAIALAALGLAALVAHRLRRGRLPLASVSVEQELAAVVDESLDELASDPDPRRAVIRAYARMEGVLGRHGYERRPAEAPLEYLRRVLGSLGAAGPAARRLTGLFERARFSAHRIDASMRDDAIDLLTAIRADLDREP